MNESGDDPTVDPIDEASIQDGGMASINRADAELGRRVRETRKKYGRNQARFAKELGVSPQAVSGWERGAGLKRDNVVAIARLTGVSVDWLSTGEGAPGGSPEAPLPPVDAENLVRVLVMIFEALGIPAAQGRNLALVALEVASKIPPPPHGSDGPDPAQIAISSALRFLDRR